MDDTACQPETKFRTLSRMTDALKSASRKVLSKISLRVVAIVLCPLVILVGTAAVVFTNLKHVQVIGNGAPKTITTFNSNPVQILKKDGVQLSPYDKVDFSGYKNNNATITYTAAFRVTVTADGKTTNVMMTGGTVADALQKAGVTVNANDIVSLPLTATLSSANSITVKRVTYATKTVYKPLSFSTVTQTTYLLPRGKSQILNPGKKGQTATMAKIEYIDGKEVSENIISNSVKSNPVSRVVLAGTAASTPVSKLSAASLQLNKYGKPVNYARCITGLATAYSAKKSARTETGRHVKVGYVAVNPAVIPFGSKLYIMTPDGSFVYGVAQAEDTGAFVHDGSGVAVDLFFATYGDSVRFGAKDVNIYVLK